MKKPKISVLLPAYNHVDYIDECIESVLNQSYRDFEFIVADDASTDGTTEKILRYEDRIDQIHLFDVNVGVPGAFLVEQAKGEYIAMINSDDVWALDKLEKQIQLLEKHPDAVACFTWCDRIDENGEELKEYNPFEVANRSREGWINYCYFNGNCFAYSSILIRKDVYIELRKRKIQMFRQIPDFYMWIILLQQYNIIMLEEKATKIRTIKKGERLNVSAGTHDNILRQFYEESYMWYRVITDMDDVLFLQTFQNELIDSTAASKVQVMCEKFLILLQTKLEFCRLAAFFFYYDNYDEMDECLSERYQITRQTMYDLMLKIGPSCYIK